jgi:ornithine cyclodeaminase
METSSLALVTAATAEGILNRDFPALRSVVERAYRAHGAGRTVNPPAQLVALPDRRQARAMSLGAHLDGPEAVLGMKWIASYPGNVGRGLERASAVVVLNDAGTGQPFACLEGSRISAARTAASAVVAAGELGGGRRDVRGLGICGAGFIADYVYRFLLADGWEPEEVAVFDADGSRARAFADRIAGASHGTARACPSVAEVIRGSDVVVFATTSSEPHVDASAFSGLSPLVLHLSLRDLAPEVVAAAQNVVDDVGHAFGPGTSLALAVANYPEASAATASLYDVMCGVVEVDLSRPRIFSPFGLGMLDVAVGRYVYDCAGEAGLLLSVPGFLPGPGPTSAVPAAPNRQEDDRQ